MDQRRERRRPGRDRPPHRGSRRRADRSLRGAGAADRRRRRFHHPRRLRQAASPPARRSSPTPSTSAASRRCPATTWSCAIRTTATPTAASRSAAGGKRGRPAPNLGRPHGARRSRARHRHRPRLDRHALSASGEHAAAPAAIASGSRAASGARCTAPSRSRAPPYTRDWGEAGAREVLAEAARRFLIEVAGRRRRPRRADPVPHAPRRAGEALRHPDRGGPAPTFIHAYERAGVVIHPYSATWARRARFAFLFPG